MAKMQAASPSPSPAQYHIIIPFNSWPGSAYSYLLVAPIVHADAVEPNKQAISP